MVVAVFEPRAADSLCSHSAANVSGSNFELLRYFRCPRAVARGVAEGAAAHPEILNYLNSDELVYCYKFPVPFLSNNKISFVLSFIRSLFNLIGEN